MKYKDLAVGKATGGLGMVLAGSDLKRYMQRQADKGAALFTVMAPRGSQARPHTPLAATAEASTEFHKDRWVGVVTATADYAIASEVGNKRRPRGDHTLQRIATMLGNTSPRRGR